MQACSATPEGSDGRTIFAAQANGQLKMPKVGNYCLTMLGDAATKVDIASAADVSVAQQHLVLFIKFDSVLGACGEVGVRWSARTSAHERVCVGLRAQLYGGGGGSK